MNYHEIAQNIKTWGEDLGFSKVGICDIDLSKQEQPFLDWLDKEFHGDMDWMARHGLMRARPAELHPGTIRVITARMNYLPPEAQFASNLEDKDSGYISRYSLGRDYHKLFRNRLNKLSQKIAQHFPELNARPFVDSAPVLERPLAEKSGLGWTGKHSLLLDKECGSWFFLGELFINLPLPIDQPSSNECGKCTSCITICPTNAIIKDGVVDARKCISYLTIEFDGVIPVEYRKAIGNRIYGCDDCQLVCPWNRFSPVTENTDFHRRSHFSNTNLLELFNWSEEEFLKKMEGSAIRRIGYMQWLRNLVIAIGNSSFSEEKIQNLKSKLGLNDNLDTHIEWAIQELQLTHSIDDEQDKKLIRIIKKGLPRDA
jgi:epoxyqueuosine reductase